MTNTSVKPLGDLFGIPVRPCMKSGFCCINAPCAYGKWNEDETACAFLGAPNDYGQRDCGKFQWIIDNVPGYQYYPAFGSGCSSAIGNSLRKSIIDRIAGEALEWWRELDEEKIKSLGETDDMIQVIEYYGQEVLSKKP